MVCGKPGAKKSGKARLGEEEQGKKLGSAAQKCKPVEEGKSRKASC
jgi:hypothetical protein